MLQIKILIPQAVTNFPPCHVYVFKFFPKYGHLCDSKCSEMCPPCKHPCDNHWMHSHCVFIYGFLCMPCMEKYEWKCEQLFQELLNRGSIIRRRNSFSTSLTIVRDKDDPYDIFCLPLE